MKRILLYLTILSLLPASLMSQRVYTIKVEATINPATADYIQRGITKASEEKAECLVIYLNTPGGLLQSTRAIVSDILESPVPVVVYVAPGGAHAGSAGVFITMAAHIAAMAPGTNIGAAHPVSTQGQMDTIMSAKATNDAAAFIRTIAEKRQRNVEWAVQAVRSSLSITENEALENNVINLVSPSLQDLLQKINGKTVHTSSGDRILHTAGAQVSSTEMSFAEKVLNVLSDPNVAYILFLLGLYGLMFELYNPGTIFPGVIGGISLILALYAMNTLPVNYAGLALIVFGVILFLLEIKIVSHGILAIGGVIALFLGSIMLIRTGGDWQIMRLSMTVIITAVVITALFFLFIVGLGLSAQKAKPVSGSEAMIGSVAEVITKLDPAGNVLVHGELWQAVSGSGAVQPGQKVKVVAIKDLTLQVELLS